jgi:hypothetical protein
VKLKNIQESIWEQASGYCKAYQNIRDHKPFQDGKELIEYLWSKYYPFADPHFLPEFKTEYYSRFWEMYLTVTLMDKGFQLSSMDSGPDIVINSEPPIYIEAVMPTGGVSVDAVKKPEPMVVVQVPEDKIILRFTHAIHEKHKQYKKWVKGGIVNNQNPFIIAVNGYSVPFTITDHELPLICKAIYPIGKEYFTFDINTQELIDQGYNPRSYIEKAHGKNIPTDTFLNPVYKEVSGVLYSRSDALNRPLVSGDDFIFIHNHKAKNPIPLGFFKFGTELYVEDNRLKSTDWNVEK